MEWNFVLYRGVALEWNFVLDRGVALEWNFVLYRGVALEWNFVLYRGVALEWNFVLYRGVALIYINRVHLRLSEMTFIITGVSSHQGGGFHCNVSRSSARYVSCILTS